MLHTIARTHTPTRTHMHAHTLLHKQVHMWMTKSVEQFSMCIDFKSNILNAIDDL